MSDPTKTPAAAPADVSDESSCGELSCDECNERYAAVKRQLADAQAENAQLLQKLQQVEARDREAAKTYRDWERQQVMETGERRKSCEAWVAAVSMMQAKVDAAEKAKQTSDECRFANEAELLRASRQLDAVTKERDGLTGELERWQKGENYRWPNRAADVADRDAAIAELVTALIEVVYRPWDRGLAIAREVLAKYKLGDINTKGTP